MPTKNYSWLDEALSRRGLESGCITAVATPTAKEGVVAGFRLDQSSPLRLAHGMRDAVPESAAVLANASGLIVVENDSGFGCNPDVLAQASRRGRAASFAWTVNSVAVVSFAERGRFLTMVDLSLLPDAGGVPAVLQSICTPDLLADADTFNSAMTMVSEFAGVQLELQDLDSPKAAYPVSGTSELDTEFVEVSLSNEYPDIVREIDRLTPSSQRAVALELAAAALRSTGTTEPAELTPALEASASEDRLVALRRPAMRARIEHLPVTCTSST